jgi:signal transduction histidine kinase
MGRRAKPAKARVEAKSPAARTSPRDEGSKVAGLEKRLAEALEREAEALERETATSEILRIISRSPSELQPVLDAVAESATRLCASYDAVIHRQDGDVLRIMAHHGPIPVPLARMIPLTRATAGGRAFLDRQTVQVVDAQVEVDEFPDTSALARQHGFHTILSVPLLRESVAIGTITLRRTTVRPFTETQIALLRTFADQAVIAIENVRLFNETKEALEQQTATAEVLRIISTSPTELQPVFDTLVANAARVCGALDVNLHLRAGDALPIVAHYGSLPLPDAHFPIDGTSVVGRAFLDRRTVHIPDLAAADELPAAQARARQSGFRTILAIPLLRGDTALGGFVGRRAEAHPFSDKQIALLQTFADQAVIAIENVRLFNELQEKNRALTAAHAQVTESLEQQTATAEILRVISRSPTDLQPVFDTIVRNARRLCEADSCSVFTCAGELIHLESIDNATVEGADAIRRAYPLPPSWGHATGRAILTGRPVHIPDVRHDPDYELHGILGAGLRSIVAVPMLRDGTAIGTITLHTWATPRPFSDAQISLLQTFADQAVIAIENVRLFKELQASNHEIADKSRQLEAASQHKSEFLANMSHELRTPLNAIIGFSEVLADGMFGEVNEKQTEYLRDILESGQHLLSLINDILDLSKVEAGRMELELTHFDLPQAISNALTLVRERAASRAIALHQAVDERLGQIRGDERKVKQVLLNLLSNALKFTPEGGRVEVRGSIVDGMAEISVTDTGVGIAPEDQEAVFEEFRQVGTADKKVEGTGLGLTLSRKFIELHGGRIWLKSQVGVGSTFTFTLPLSI